MSEQGFDNPLDALVGDETSTETETVQPPEGQGQSDVDSTSAVQPEGQGQQDAQTGLYDLSTVPEEHRSFVEEHLKNIERNANAKFQEHAEYRKSWEPFGELGLQDVGAEGVGALLEFAQDLSNPETARDAILAIAQAAGVDLDQAEAMADEADDNDAPLTRAEFEAWQNQQRQQWEEQQQLNTLREQALAGYQKEFAEVEGLNGKPFEGAEKQRLIALAKRFQSDHDEPIKAAFEFMQSLRGEAEKALVDGQPTPPAPSEPGGRASSPVQPVDDWDEALRLHRERNASAHA